jgi:hypothetical protein
VVEPATEKAAALESWAARSVLGQKRRNSNRALGIRVRTVKREFQMRKLSLLLILLSVAGMLPSTESFGQSALRGAVIGGAIGGRRGAAIGATAGAVAGAHRRHHWHRYYWSHGSCWYRSSSGRSHRVSHRYC